MIQSHHVNILICYLICSYDTILPQAMSHMLCIGYGRFPPQNLTDLWLTIFRCGQITMKMKMKMKMKMTLTMQHDGWSDLLRNVPWSRHQSHTGSNWIKITITIIVIFIALIVTYQYKLCFPFVFFSEFGLVATSVPGKAKTGQSAQIWSTSQFAPKMYQIPNMYQILI